MNKNRNNKPHGIIKLSSIFKILLLLILAVIIFVGTIVTTLVLGIFKKSPEIDPTNYRTIMAETSRIYSDDDQLIQTLVDDEFSEFVPMDKFPKYLSNAFVAIEDERFYEHNAVDFRRVLGALVHDLKTRSMEQGASTITMQLAKNLYTSSSKSIPRKLTDIYYAYQIEANLTKPQILEAYLNCASFSKGTIGVGAAAHSFFDKDVSDLSLAECALLAGVTNRPEEFTPYNYAEIQAEDDPENVQVVLRPNVNSNYENPENLINFSEKLMELGKIDSFDLIQIKNNTYIPYKAVFNPNAKTRQARVLKKMFEQKLITEDDYNKALNEDITIKIGKRREYGISSFYTDLVQKEVKGILLKLGYSDEEAHNKLFNGGLKIYTPMNMEIQKILEETVADPQYYRGSFTDKSGVVQPQVACVIIDQKTHEVKALVGGRGVGGGQLLNRATVKRQPGSSIKPISVYLTAFNNGTTAGDVFLDSPIPKSAGFNNPPRNNANSYRGWTTVRNLVIRSSNVGAFQVLRDISVDKNSKSNKFSTYPKVYNDEESINKVVDTLESIGITSIVKPDPSKPNTILTNDMSFSPLALGGMTHGISPLQMAGAYTTLADEGKYSKPILISKILSNNGDTIYKADVDEKEITSKQNAYILTDILKDVVKRGTGRNASFRGMPVAGKTGTTTDKRDVWFCGYTPYYTASVWIGCDKNQTLHFGSDRAAYLWKEIMKKVHEGLDDKDFEEPDGIYTKYVNGRRELFADGTEPHYTSKLSWDDNDDDEESQKPKKKKSDNNNNNNNDKKNENSNDENSHKKRKRRKSDNNNNVNSNSNGKDKKN